MPSNAERASERIRQRTEANIAYHTNNPERIPQRLEELDAEWDLERALAAGTSGLTLASLLFTILRGGKWLLLGLGVQGFAMQHALGGRCAPIDLLRSMGLRTRQEIESERRQLESLLDDAGGPDEGGTGDEQQGGQEGWQQQGSQQQGSQPGGQRQREPSGSTESSS